MQLHHDSHIEREKINIEEKARLLSAIIAPVLAQNSLPTLLSEVDLLKQTYNLSYLSIIDRHKNKLVNNDFPSVKNIGSTLGMSEVIQVIESNGIKIGELKVGFPIKDVVYTLNSREKTMLALAVTGSIFSLIMMMLYILTRSKQLKNLASGVVALEQGDNKSKIDFRGRNEIANIARAFNQLMARLKNTKDALSKERKTSLRDAEHRKTMLDHIDAVIIESDSKMERFSFVNGEAENLLGFNLRKWKHKNFWREQLHPLDKQRVIEKVEEHGKIVSSYNIEYRLIHQSGGIVWVKSINRNDFNENGDLVCQGLLLNISEQKNIEEQLVYLADHDALTGLYNRRRFQEELKHHMVLAENFQHEGALIFIDLDQFKFVNDTFGHPVGDKYLKNVTNCLCRIIRPEDTLGRLGGDEFGIILPQTSRIQVAEITNNILNELLGLNISKEGKTASITASIGVVMFSGQTDGSGDIMAKADAAMYSAKNSGHNNLHFYADNDEELIAMRAKIHWEDRISHCLKENKFELHFQPIFNLINKEILYYEVLLRMIADDGGLIFPGSFLAIAEKYGMIKNIDKWVIEKSIRTQGESIKNGTPVSLAINLSGRVLGKSEIIRLIEKSIEKYDADPTKLIFEVTETAAIENVNRAQEFVDSLHALGCQFALDDFGVGHSSLHYLKKLHVDILKIDGSFIRNVDKDKFDRIFVKAIHDMAQGLKIKTVAEFVESEAIRKDLQALKIDSGQGYYLGMPQKDIF